MYWRCCCTSKCYVLSDVWTMRTLIRDMACLSASVVAKYVSTREATTGRCLTNRDVSCYHSQNGNWSYIEVEHNRDIQQPCTMASLAHPPDQHLDFTAMLIALGGFLLTPFVAQFWGKDVEQPSTSFQDYNSTKNDKFTMTQPTKTYAEPSKTIKAPEAAEEAPVVLIVILVLASILISIASTVMTLRKRSVKQSTTMDSSGEYLAR